MNSICTKTSYWNMIQIWKSRVIERSKFESNHPKQFRLATYSGAYITFSKAYAPLQLQYARSNWPRFDFWWRSKYVMTAKLLALCIGKLLVQLIVFTFHSSTELTLLGHLRQWSRLFWRNTLFLAKGDMTDSRNSLLQFSNNKQLKYS